MQPFSALANKFEQIVRHFKPGYSRPREQMVVEGMAATSLPISKQLCELAHQERIPCIPWHQLLLIKTFDEIIRNQKDGLFPAGFKPATLCM